MTDVLPGDCCNGFVVINFGKVELPAMYINWTDPNLWFAAATIAFNPMYWNVMARLEYKSQVLSQVFGSRRIGCIVLAASVFSLGIFRDLRFSEALASQPRWYFLQQNWILWTGYLCMAVGTMFVLTSFYALGFYGTFLGDYFGFLMEKKVTGFPFSILDNPMYWGSTLNFLGGSIVKASQSGLLLTLLIAIGYKIAILFEGPFTAMIYSERDRSRYREREQEGKVTMKANIPDMDFYRKHV